MPEKVPKRKEKEQMRNMFLQEALQRANAIFNEKPLVFIHFSGFTALRHVQATMQERKKSMLEKA